jgi:thioredoxin reductase
MYVKNLIIGAGPAGIQMGSLFQDTQDYLIVDKASEPCAFFREFPRQRHFISINKSRHLRYDWNSFLGPEDAPVFRDYSEKLYPDTDSYLEYVRDFCKHRNINFKFNFEVKSIEKDEQGQFVINGGEIKADRVFYGTGVVPKKPPVIETTPGVQVYTYANMPLDPDLYRDKLVHIVGYGNAALETADWLAPYTDVTEIWGNERNAWKTHYPGHARSINFTSVDSYYLKGRTVFHFGNPEESFMDTSKFRLFKTVMKELGEHTAKRTVIIWCIGFEFNSSLVKDLVKVNKFPVLTANFESTICPNLFFIGSATQHHDYKQGTSAFIHGFRYNCEYLYNYISNTVSCYLIKNREQLISKIFDQLNNSSALFHRFDQFCDLIGIDDEQAYYIQEIPLLAVEQFVRPEWTKYFTIKLGYTRDFADTFQQVINNHPAAAHKSKFIHPIIQFNSLTFHIPEEAINEFNDPKVHIYPMELYLSYILSERSLDEVKQLISQIS